MVRFNLKYFDNSLIFSNFVEWDRWNLQPTDKGKLTAFPTSKNLSASLNVSNMKLPKINSERWLDLTDLEGEVWRDVVGYEGLYSVSNFGRIMSHKRKSKQGTTVLRCLPNRLNYTSVCLCCAPKKIKRVAIHRIVAMAFLPNPCGYPEINHKDENPSNNCADNLEWCDRKYNNNYGGHNARQSATKRKSGALAKEVHQYDMDGNYMASYISSKEAERSTMIPHSNISYAANGKTDSAGGYMWTRVKVDRLPKYHFANGIKVYQYDMNWNFIAEYESVRIANVAVGGAKKSNTIHYCCRGKYSQAYGYKWSYEKL